MQRIAFDDWVLEPSSGELSRGTVTVRLQDQPMKVLLALLERPGELVTREELIARLWPKVVVDYDTSLKAIVRKLRIALEDDAEQPRYIETLPRKGYRFIGRIRHALPAVPTTEAPTSRKRLRPLALAGALIALAFVLLATVLSPPAPQPHVRLGVLPFRNLSPDPELAFFADGLYEETLTSLASGTTEIDVISRTTMTVYDARQRSIADLARELGVTHVLEGSVRRENDAVRITVQLIDARRDGHLWAENYDRTLVSATSLQSEVARAVATQLGFRLAPHDAAPPSANPAAVDSYFKALIAMKAIDQRTPLATLEAAEAHATAAIDLDGAYAAAYALRAQLRLLKYVNNHDISDANRAAARDDIDAAERLGGSTVPVLQALARYSALFGDGPDHAIEILDVPEIANASEPELLRWRAFFLCRAGRRDEGLEAYRRAVALDPANAALVGAYVSELWTLRRPLAALEVVRAFNALDTGRTIGTGDLMFAFTGATEPLDADIAGGRTTAADNRLLARYDLLRFQNRRTELQSLVASLSPEPIRLGGFREYGLPGTGTQPPAELRGWVHLLYGERGAAAEDGRSILELIATRPASTHNVWHRHMLAATGWLFVGDSARAVAEAREALEKTPKQFDFVNLYSRLLAARVYAWADAHDEAIDILEQLSSGYPGVGPAEIARDPLFSRPLATSARFTQLQQRLEAEIERNGALLAD